MKIEHIAIWTHNLEGLKDFYCQYFGGRSNEKYINQKKQFESYFISFESGARLELMSRADILHLPKNSQDPMPTGYTHFAFGVPTMDEVDAKAKELAAKGFSILSGPRLTGDGYYEFETMDPDGNRVEVATLFA
jgi:lactoylglutathione lyase